MKIIDAKDAKIQFTVGIVVSRFNVEFTKPLLDGALQRIKECGFPDNQVTVLWVPGAIEIPLAAQKLAQLGVYEAIICLGVVIKGETEHYRYVCEQVSSGCQQVALQNDLPVIFGVLTTETDDQVKERIGGKHGHKGREAVDAAIEAVAALRQIG